MERSSSGVGHLSFDPREMNTLDGTRVRLRRLPAFKSPACRDTVPYGTRRPAGAQGRDVLTSGAMLGRAFAMAFASPAALGLARGLGALLKGKSR